MLDAVRVWSEYLAVLIPENGDVLFYPSLPVRADSTTPPPAKWK